MSDASLPTNHDIGFEVSPGTTYPSTFSTPIAFANPDSMLSGTLRGTQFVGSNTLQIDSTQNLITIKNSAAALNQTGVLRIGSVAQNYLGFAVNNGTVDTMFAGQDSTGATVIKVAKSGYDAKTATNDQLIFNSAQNVFKVVKSGTINFVPPDTMTSGQVATTTIAHGLSVTPAFQVYVKNPSIGIPGAVAGGLTNLPSPIYFIGASGATILYVNQARVDSTNLYIDFINLQSGTQTGVSVLVFSYQYYIYQETAS